MVKFIIVMGLVRIETLLDIPRMAKFTIVTDFNLVTKEKLNWVQNALNERPRQTLEFNRPKETFNSLLLKY